MHSEHSQTKNEGVQLSALKQPIDEIARLYDDEGGRRYRESLGKLTLMTNPAIWNQYVQTVQYWERVRNLAQQKLYTHPDLELYIGMLDSCLELMKLNEETIDEIWKKHG